MPGEAVVLGPFEGGINTLSDPTMIADNELVDCVNYDIDVDGSLKSRPPFYTLANPASGATRMVILGYFTIGGVDHLLGCNSAGIWRFTTGAWTVIVASVKSTAMVQYDGKAWVVATADSSANGGSWDGTTWVSIAAIPRGESAIVHKERLWIVPGPNATANDSVLKFSAVTDFTNWPAANAILVGKGDGQKLVHTLVFNDNIFLFKQDSTFHFAFDASPSQGVLREVNPNIGTANRFCVVAYENQLYILHEGNVYEMINTDFNKINTKIPFVYDPTQPSPWGDPTYITLIGQRLLVRYYAKLYVFNLKARVWTRWETALYPGPFMPRPVRGETTVNVVYIAGSAVLNQGPGPIYAFEDGYSSNVEAGISCKIKTKDYDMESSHTYKRLFWWGVDLVSNSQVTGKINPITASYGVRWSDLHTYTWDQLAGNTWDQPLSTPTSIEDIVPPESSTLNKIFIKFLQAIRFKKVNFEVTTSYDGTIIKGPVRLFSLTALVRIKQHASKTVT